VTIDAHGCMVNLDNERCAFFRHTFVLNQNEESCMIIQINILFKALMVPSANTKLCGHYEGETLYLKGKEHQE
jgi:hypothetical protein